MPTSSGTEKVQFPLLPETDQMMNRKTFWDDNLLAGCRLGINTVYLLVQKKYLIFNSIKKLFGANSTLSHEGCSAIHSVNASGGGNWSYQIVHSGEIAK